MGGQAGPEEAGVRGSVEGVKGKARKLFGAQHGTAEMKGG